MQNSMWKLATLLGVIGVGCLVVMQLQKGLPNKAPGVADVSPAGDAVPNVTPADPFAMDASNEVTAGFGGNAFADDFGATEGQSEPGMASASYGEPDGFSPTPASQPIATPEAADPFGAGAFEDLSLGQEEPVQPAAMTAQTPPSTATEDDLFGGFGGVDAASYETTPTTIQTDAAPTTAAQEDPFDPFAASEPAPLAQPVQQQPAAAPQEQEEFDDSDSLWGSDADTIPATESKPAPPQPLPSPTQFGERSVEPSPFDEPAADYDPAPAVQRDPIPEPGRASFETAPSLPDPAPMDDWAMDPEPVGGMAPPMDDQSADPFGSSEPARLPALDSASPFGDTPPYQPETRQAQPSELPPLPVERAVVQPKSEPYGIRPVGATRFARSLDSVPHGTLEPKLQIEKSAPSTGAIGKPLIYSISIRNVGNADANSVVVEDYIPAGARLTGTIPQAELVEDRLIWKFDKLKPQEAKVIQIRVVPEEEGDVGSVATVNFKAEIGSRTKITSPRLRLELKGQSEAKIGDTIVFKYRISNVGTGDATNVWLRNPLPSELEHPQGADLEYEVGDLPKGTSRDITLQLVAAGSGDVRNTAVVTAEGGVSDRAEAMVSILGAQLTVTRRGPQRRFLNRPGVYENTVTNRTHRDSDPATLVEQIPEGMEFIRADNGGQYNELKRTVVWAIPTIRSGQQLTYAVQLKPVRAGNHESIVQVTERSGFQARANASTQVVHLKNMGLDLSQLDGPLAVGEKVVFTIDVRNRGTSPSTNSILTLTVPRELRVLEAGPLRANQDGGTVQFEAVPKIDANGRKRFQVAFIAQSAAEDVRLKASVRSDQMPNRLITEESITIYDEEGR